MMSPEVQHILEKAIGGAIAGAGVALVIGGFVLIKVLFQFALEAITKKPDDPLTDGTDQSG